jgi:hypothetical protein
MDLSVKMTLIWAERTDPPNTYRVREFPTLDILNDFLMALDGNNVKSIKVISGITLEHREEDLQ